MILSTDSARFCTLYSLSVSIMSKKPAVYLGTFIHCKSLEEVEILHDAAIFVDQEGKIVGIEKGIKDVEEALKFAYKLGWETEDVIARACGREQFFFPGFVGMGASITWTLYLIFTS